MNTYAYVNDTPIMDYDLDGLEAVVYMYQHPLGFGKGPSWLSPAVKEVICKAVNHCAGDMNCVYNVLNKARHEDWYNPIKRQAENFATAAADDSVGYPKSWAAHNQLGIWYYQYEEKPWMIQHHIPTTPVSDDAYAAGVAGAYFHGMNPSMPLKWCDHCDSQN